MEELGINTDELHKYQDAWEAGGKTVVLIAVDGIDQGLIGIADKLKALAQVAVAALQKIKIEVIINLLPKRSPVKWELKEYSLGCVPIRK